MNNISCKKNKTNNLYILGFILGIFAGVFSLTYLEISSEPAGIIDFDIQSTTAGTVKVLYSKDGVTTDPNLSIYFDKPQTTWRHESFSLPPGHYDWIGIKPLIESQGRVGIRNLRISSSDNSKRINLDNFMAINQIDAISTDGIVGWITPKIAATDPFGIFNSVGYSLKKLEFDISNVMQILISKIFLVALFLFICYSLFRVLPFFSGSNFTLIHLPFRYQFIGIFALGVLVLTLRNASYLSFPILYAEDGSWSSGLYNRGFLEMLLNAKEGHTRYFVFGNLILLEISLLLNKVFFGSNITNIPYFISGVSTAFFSGLAALSFYLLKNFIVVKARVILWIMVLLLPLGGGSFEILGRLANVGFAFLYLSFCILLWRNYSLKNSNTSKIIISDLILFICANTNPLCYVVIFTYFIFEIYINLKLKPLNYKYFFEFKFKSMLFLIFFLSLTALIIVFREKGPDIFLSGPIQLSNLIEMIFGRIFLFPLIYPFYSYFSNFLILVFSMLFIFFVVHIVRSSYYEKRVIIFSFFILIFATYLTTVGRPALTQVFSGWSNTGVDRYFYGLSLFVVLIISAFISAAWRDEVSFKCKFFINALAGFIFTIYVANSSYMYEFISPRWSDLPALTFKEQLFAAYKTPEPIGDGDIRYKVNIHPNPLAVYFPKDLVEASILRARRPPGNQELNSSQNEVIKSKTATIYEGKIIRQKPAGRGREDGWFYVTNGSRFWILSDEWLKRRGVDGASVIEVTNEEFSAIPDSGLTLK